MLDYPLTALQSPPPAIWQHFSVFIPHLFLFDSQLLLPLKFLLSEIVCKGSLFLSASSVIFSLVFTAQRKSLGSICTSVVVMVVQERDHICTHASLLHTLWGKVRKDDGLATRCLFTPHCEVESSKFRLEPPHYPTCLQARCEGCSVISTCWLERCIWLSVKSARALFIQQLCSCERLPVFDTSARREILQMWISGCSTASFTSISI